MSYALQDLVRVREHREEQASEAVARARRLLREAEAALVQAQTNLAEYAAWRIEEEQRMLDGLMRRVLRLGELNDTRQDIALLREREFDFIDKVKQAEAAVAKAEAHLDECRQRHAKAVRDLEKLVEHRAQWQHERTLEMERTEDLELEDFSPRAASSAIGDPYERN